jgi:hypothetical protein
LDAFARVRLAPPQVLTALFRTLALHAGSLRSLALRKLDPPPVVSGRPGVGNGLEPPPPPALLPPPSASKNTSDGASKLQDLLEELAALVRLALLFKHLRPRCEHHRVLQVVALRESLTTLDLSNNSIHSLGVLSRAIAHSGVEVLLLEGNPLNSPAVQNASSSCLKQR